MNAGKLYKESVAHSMDSVSLVLTMYDILLDDLRQAIRAIHAGDIEGRTKKIRHALEAIQQLQMSIDFKNGGDTANCLDTLYSIVRAKVLQAQFQQKSTILEEQIERIKTVRDAWQELVLRQATPAATGEGQSMPPGGDEGAASMDWRV
jgi:flagellar protein FliS